MHWCPGRSKDDEHGTHHTTSAQFYPANESIIQSSLDTNTNEHLHDHVVS